MEETMRQEAKVMEPEEPPDDAQLIAQFLLAVIVAFGGFLGRKAGEAVYDAGRKALDQKTNEVDN